MAIICFLDEAKKRAKLFDKTACAFHSCEHKTANNDEMKERKKWRRKKNGNNHSMWSLSLSNKSMNCILFPVVYVAVVVFSPSFVSFFVLLARCAIFDPKKERLEERERKRKKEEKRPAKQAHMFPFQLNLQHILNARKTPSKNAVSPHCFLYFARLLHRLFCLFFSFFFMIIIIFICHHHFRGNRVSIDLLSVHWKGKDEVDIEVKIVFLVRPTKGKEKKWRKRTCATKWLFYKPTTARNNREKNIIYDSKPSVKQIYPLALSFTSLPN